VSLAEISQNRFALISASLKLILGNFLQLKVLQSRFFRRNFSAILGGNPPKISAYVPTAPRQNRQKRIYEDFLRKDLKIPFENSAKKFRHIYSAKGGKFL